MKTYRKLLYLFLFPLMVTSCFEDETTLGDNPISDIFIESGSIEEEYNIYRNDTLRITPRLTQNYKDKPMTFKWEIDLETYSADTTFLYVGKKLGSYKCRFIAENEDGKTFFPFVLNVNSPYEEGLTVISRDEQGKSYISFKKTPTPGEEDMGFLDYECFSVNNPDVNFASNVSDIVQSSGRLIVSCEGGNDAGDIPTIYYLNEKTLMVENVMTLEEYSEFVPTMLCVPSMEAVGVTYPILCRDGSVFEFSTTEGQLQPSRTWRANYAQLCVVYGQSANRFDILLWDNDLNGLRLYYNGYGPYVCHEEWDSVRLSKQQDELNYFKNRDLVTMTIIRMTEEQLKTYNPEFLIVTKKSSLPLAYRNILYTGFWMTDIQTYETNLVMNESMCGMAMTLDSIPFNVNTPCIANRTYYSFLFGEGNKVKKWYYTSSHFTTSEVLTTVGSENAVITGFEISDDHKQTYVAFYEPLQSGKNGSVWVIDTDKGDIIKRYDNIAYQPKKIIYKKK